MPSENTLFSSAEAYLTEEEILQRTSALIGKPLKDISPDLRLRANKGGVGTFIEKYWFHIPTNSRPEPDFAEAKIELKVFPFRRVKTKQGTVIKAKERLVCNMINYLTEGDINDFTQSSFWKKCSSLLLLAYEHRPGVDKTEFSVEKFCLYRFPAVDRQIIENDWRTIRDKIRAGKAHELSEGDTLYLGAATKSSSSAARRPQKYSAIEAKPRAFCLKQGYVTHLLSSYLFGSQTDEAILTQDDVNALRTRDFAQVIREKIAPYRGMSAGEISTKFGVFSSSKSIATIAVARIFGLSGKLENAQELKKAGVVPKVIRLEHDGKIRESMSFPTFRYTDLVNQEWEDSRFYQQLSAKFLFIVYRNPGSSRTPSVNYVLEDVFLWNLPAADLAEACRVWERTRQVIISGVEVTSRGSRLLTNFPGLADSPVAHVRPHARNGADTYPLPDGRNLTKRCFWLNRGYLENQLRSLMSS
ncbi:hypothetical protein KRX54_01970 [Actinomycetaceae bacterium TAE3-ERU4]|nr:hypothetical protein [Actinomycetaceae bacterium TAE3-ERU4]